MLFLFLVITGTFAVFGVCSKWKKVEWLILGALIGVILGVIAIVQIMEALPKVPVIETYGLHPVIYSEDGGPVYVKSISENQGTLLLFRIDEDGVPRDDTLSINDSITILYDAVTNSWMEHTYQAHPEEWYDILFFNARPEHEYVFHLHPGEADIELNDLLGGGD